MVAWWLTVSLSLIVSVLAGPGRKTPAETATLMAANARYNSVCSFCTYILDDAFNGGMSLDPTFASGDCTTTDNYEFLENVAHHNGAFETHSDELLVTADGPAFSRRRECDAGSHSPSFSWFPFCTDCPEGLMRELRDVDCSRCPDGQVPSADQSTCEDCPDGTYANGAKCVDCPTGYYSTGGTTCEICEKGRYATSGACVGCPDGLVNPHWSALDTCVACIPGTASAGNHESCVLPGRGTYYPGGTATELDLTAGYFHTTDTGMRAAATAGLEVYPGYREDNHRLAVCPDGEVSDTPADGCSDCLAGSWAVQNMGSCELCIAGRFQGSTGRTSCTGVCSSDQHNTDTPGSTSSGGACADCPAGRVNPSNFLNMDSCYLCAPGLYASSGRCGRCPAGQSTSLGTVGDGDGSCADCPAGKYAAPTSGESASGMECSDCWPGFESGIGASTCTECPGGKYADDTSGGICQNCPDGKFTPGTGRTACVDCAAGYYALSGVNFQCTAASAGHAVAITGQSTQVPCSAGKYAYSTGTIACQDCPFGRFTTATTQTSCTECPIGLFSDSSRASGQVCDECPVGRFAGTAGLSSCLFCAIGFESNAVLRAAAGSPLTACSACEPGYFASSTETETCTGCPTGKATNIYGATVCVDCATGLYAPSTGMAECIACPQGSVATGTGADSCDVCTDSGTGFFTDFDGGQVCYACPEETFRSADGLSCGACDSRSIFNPATKTCPPCDPGTIVTTITDGSQVCEDCPAGLFQNGPICSGCPAGAIAPTARLDSCTDCLGGTRQFNSTFCEDCPSGRYSNDTQTSCTPCDGNTFAITGSPACTACDRGSVTTGGACSPCPVGTFHPSDHALDCLDCEPGFFAGTVLSPECLACEPGWFSSSTGDSVCTQCSAGLASNVTAANSSDVCTDCTGNSAAAEGSPFCVDCEQGLVHDGTHAVCENCTLGKFHLDRSNETCTDCPEGRYAPITGLSICLPCEPGKFNSKTGRSSCVDCPSGQEAPDYAQTACTKCEGNTNATEAGTAECLLCPFGEITNGVVCTPCDTGRFHENQTFTECTQCPIGRFANVTGIEGACHLCEPGYTATVVELSVCDICREGTFSPEFGWDVDCVSCNLTVNQVAETAGLSACDTCSPGSITSRGISCDLCDAGTFHQNETSNECANCPLGRFALEPGTFGTCDPCGAGNFSSTEGNVLCDKCDAGTFTSGSGRSDCDPCLGNHIAEDTGMSECTLCEQGFINSRNISCQACQSGLYHANRTDTFCSECPVGLFASGSNATACGQCGVGFFYDTITTNDCQECSIGRFQNVPAQTFCVDCYNLTNTVAEESAAAGCDLCPLGTIAVTHTRCDECPRGFYHADQNATVCTECETGRFADETGLSACVDCSPGSYANVIESKTCKLCSIGLYAPNNGTVDCSECPGNSIAGARGLSVCDDCGAGSVVTSATSKRRCTQCPRGQYHPVEANTTATNVTVCLNCQPGSVAGNPASTHCDLCTAGTFQTLEGEVACESCETGSFADGLGNPTCTECFDNTFITGSAASACEDCAHGFITVERQRCDPCDAGRYHVENSTECTPCELGRFAPNNATRSNCTDCSPGFYASQTLSLSCLPCDAGRYVGESGRSDCDRCDFTINERSNASSGASGCELCPAGFTADATVDIASSGCSACAAGRYHPQPNATVCLSCEAGRFQPFSNATTCVVCELGKTSSEGTIDGCDNCPLGMFGENDEVSGYPKCTTCIDNSIAASTGLTVCEECDVGLLQESKQTCLACRPNQYKDFVTFECKECPSGQRLISEDLLEVFAGDPEPCEACPAGKQYTGSPSVYECEECADGQYQPDTSQTSCLNCNVGVFANRLSTSDYTDCILCTAGYFASTSSGRCERCDSGRFSGDDAKECTDVPTGNFDFGNQTGYYECPSEGVDCIGSRNLSIIPGYWWNMEKYPIITDNTELFECLNPDACIVNSVTQTVTCATGHDNNTVLCATCSEGYSLDVLSNLCNECKAAVQQLVVVVIIGILAVAGSIFFVHRSGTTDAHSESTPLFRILINYFNSSAVLGTLEFTMPSKAEAFLSQFLSSDPSAAVFSPARCLANITFVHEFYFFICLPVLLYFMSQLIACGFRVVTKGPWSKIQVMLVFYFLAFNRLATVFFTVLDLYPKVIDGRQYMRADFSISNIDSDAPNKMFAYSTLRVIAICGLFIYCIIPPVLLLLIIWGYQERLNAANLKPLRFLYMGYQLGPRVSGAIPKRFVQGKCCSVESMCRCSRREYKHTDILKYGTPRWYWEFVVMGRKMILLFVATFSWFSANPFIQLFTTMVILAWFLTVHLMMKPFEAVVCDYAETLSLTSLLLQQVMVLVWKEYDDNGRYAAADTVQWLSFFVTVSTLGILGVIVAHFGTEGGRFYFITRCWPCLPRKIREPRPARVESHEDVQADKYFVRRPPRSQLQAA